MRHGFWRPVALVNPVAWFGQKTGCPDMDIAKLPDGDPIIRAAVLLSVVHDDYYNGKGAASRVYYEGTYPQDAYFMADAFVKALAAQLRGPEGDAEAQEAWEGVKGLLPPAGKAEQQKDAGATPGGQAKDQSTQGPKLLRCHTIAYDSCQWVNREQPTLVPQGKKRFCREMYDYVIENYPKYNDAENPITKPGFESWCRYVRFCEQHGYKGDAQTQQQPRSAVSRTEAEDLGHLTSKFDKPD